MQAEALRNEGSREVPVDFLQVGRQLRKAQTARWEPEPAPLLCRRRGEIGHRARSKSLQQRALALPGSFLERRCPERHTLRLGGISADPAWAGSPAAGDTGNCSCHSLTQSSAHPALQKQGMPLHTVLTGCSGIIYTD